MLRLAIAAAALLSLSACAGGARNTADTRDCFRNADIFSYGVIDANHVNIRAHGVEYILTTTGDTYDLEWSRTLVVRSPSGRICTGPGYGVEIVGGSPPRRLIVTDIRRVVEPPPPEGS